MNNDAKPCTCMIPQPGRIFETTPDGHCAKCGRQLRTKGIEYLIRPDKDSHIRWDKYFLDICNAVATKSPCLSRQIGAILVRDKSIVATGYNGPARGFPHCEGDLCRRRKLGYASGEGLSICPAAHAEGNCIANAARNGVITVDCILYLNTLIPCKDCMILLVNAGIKEVVATSTDYYHTMSAAIAEHGNIIVREFLCK